MNEDSLVQSRILVHHQPSPSPPTFKEYKDFKEFFRPSSDNTFSTNNNNINNHNNASNHQRHRSQRRRLDRPSPSVLKRKDSDQSTQTNTSTSNFSSSGVNSADTISASSGTGTNSRTNSQSLSQLSQPNSNSYSNSNSNSNSNSSNSLGEKSNSNTSGQVLTKSGQKISGLYPIDTEVVQPIHRPQPQKLNTLPPKTTFTPPRTEGHLLKLPFLHNTTPVQNPRQQQPASKNRNITPNLTKSLHWPMSLSTDKPKLEPRLESKTEPPIAPAAPGSKNIAERKMASPADFAKTHQRNSLSIPSSTSAITPASELVKMRSILITPPPIPQHPISHVRSANMNEKSVSPLDKSSRTSSARRGNSIGIEPTIPPSSNSTIYEKSISDRPNLQSTLSEQSEVSAYSNRSASSVRSGKSPSDQSKVKKYTCSTCSQSFTRQHNLKSHQLTHSEQKPYGCSNCGMSFRRLHDMRRHSALHSGEKPFTCTVCSRGFARQDALSRHLKATGECGSALQERTQLAAQNTPALSTGSTAPQSASSSQPSSVLSLHPPQLPTNSPALTPAIAKVQSFSYSSAIPILPSKTTPNIPNKQHNQHWMTSHGPQSGQQNVVYHSLPTRLKHGSFAQDGPRNATYPSDVNPVYSQMPITQSPVLHPIEIAPTSNNNQDFQPHNKMNPPTSLPGIEGLISQPVAPPNRMLQQPLVESPNNMSPPIPSSFNRRGSLPGNSGYYSPNTMHSNSLPSVPPNMANYSIQIPQERQNDPLVQQLYARCLQLERDLQEVRERDRNSGDYFDARKRGRYQE